MLNKLLARMRRKKKAQNSTNFYGTSSDRKVSRTSNDGIFSNPMHQLNPINPLNSTFNDDYSSPSRRSESTPTCYVPDYSNDNDSSSGRGADSPSSPSSDGGCGGSGSD